MTQYLLEGHRSQETGLTLTDVWKVFSRRRRVAYTILGSIVMLTAIYCIFATRRYTATGVVQLQKEGASGIDLTDLSGTPAGSGAEDALGTSISLETQADILRSDTLALKVIKDLNLENSRDFRPHFNPIGWVMGLFSPSGIADPAGASLDNSPQRRTRVLRVFSKDLKVKTLAGTRLIDVSYTNSDPHVAAAVVNRLIQGLTDYEFQTKIASTSEAAGWLSGQLSELRKQSEDEQEKLATLQKQVGIFSIGTDSQGREQVYSDVLDKLQQSTAALSAADSNRILKEAVYKAAKSGNAELISELSGTGAGNGAQPVYTSLNLIQSLRLQQATLQSQIADAEQRYGPAYPKMIELRASLADVNKSIAQEIERVGARAKSDYEIALQADNQARQEYLTNRKAADDLKDKAVDYSILREEATQSRSLYEDVLRKLKEAGVLEGLKASNLTVVDPGRVPSKPSKPNIPLFLALSLAVGSLFGLGGALLAESMDTTIRSVEQVESLGAPLYGMLPQYASGRKELEGLRHSRTLDAPRSAYSEAVRGLRASLAISGINTEGRRVVLVTSASPGEGKSLTAKNLAVSLAQQGKRVLLVDADLRRPSEDKGLEWAGKEGLSTMLSTTEKSAGIVQVDGMPQLFVLPAGPIPANPAELLGSPRMAELLTEFRSQFDTVVVDSPPVLPVVDALLLSELADSNLLVARDGVTVRDSLKHAYKLLSMHARKSTIGIVLNGVTMDSEAYHSYFGPKTSQYYTEDANEVA